MSDRPNPLLRFTDSILDRILCVIGAVGLSQGPEFMQQYTQRLGGHLDEAQRQLAQFSQTSAQAGLSLPEYITRTSTNADTAVAKLGGVMAASAERVDELSAALVALRDANLWERPFVFLRHVDTQIAGATWEAFKPAVPTTLEGLVYALAGMAAALLIYHLGIALPLSRMFKKRAALKRARA